MRAFRSRDQRGEDFYFRALECAASLWLQALPAQSLLLINRAFSADLSAGPAHPLPYAAVAWILERRGGGGFIGNPRRHYQHLATRMVEPRAALRTARAWACWHLADAHLPQDGFPTDTEQLAAEKISAPGREKVATSLTLLGLPAETALWEAAF
jgi:hypothetical protein